MLDDDKMKNSMTDEKRKEITNYFDETIKWIDANLSASADEFSAKKSELDTFIKNEMAACRLNQVMNITAEVQRRWEMDPVLKRSTSFLSSFQC